VILANAFWLAQLIRQRKVKIIHARSRAPAWSAFLASRMVPCRFVTTFHAAYKYSNPIKKFYNRVMAKADLMIAISDFIAGYIRKGYGVEAGKIRIIPRGIDFDLFAPDKVAEGRLTSLRQAWGIDAVQTLILLPSRLSPIKGQAILIKAMVTLMPDFKNVTAILLGDDQGRVGYHRELQAMIEAHNLQKHVRIVPHCSDMPAAYRLASLVIAPSLVPEGFGRVPVEAMAMGVPVIATALGGHMETIRPGATGWLVPPGDPWQLKNVMLMALSQPAEQRTAMTEAAMADVRRRYNKRKMVADTLAVYAELARS
jgi:glycosyltransferase involved in cell wall biosynthesis